MCGREEDGAGVRCPHEMFYSGAGACPQCSATGTVERCEVCGEHLSGEIAEVVRHCANCGQRQDEHSVDPATKVMWCVTGARASDLGRTEYSWPEHLIVHESCYDREAMELA